MFSKRISDDIPPQMKILNLVIPILIHLKLECCKPHNAACHPMKCDVINDVKMFPAVYHRIYCHKFLMLSNQKLHYKTSALEWSVVGNVIMQMLKLYPFLYFKRKEMDY